MEVPEPLLAELVRQAVAEAVRTAPIPTLRPAESRGGDPTGGTVQVVLDGDDVELTFQCLVPVPARGVRVMVLLQPPSSGVVVGYANGGQMFPTGSFVGFGGDTPPEGWLLCDGRSLSKVQWGNLYAVLGVRFGGTLSGTTFNLPDLRGRVLLGLDGGTGRIGTQGDAIGDSGGAATHMLTTAELANHSHGVPNVKFNTDTTHAHNSQTGFLAEAADDSPGAASPSVTDFVGGNVPHNNVQPFLAANWIVKA